jgi:hypothetical protein
VIEGLYRKVNGSLEGLDARLKRATDGSGVEVEAALSSIAPAEKSSPDALTANAPAPETTGAGGKTESVPDQKSGESEKKESQLKLSLPPFSSGRAASANKPARSGGATKQPASESLFAVPLTDPMFAKKPATNEAPASKPSEPATEDPTPAATTPEPEVVKTPPPVRAAPIELPSIESIYDQPVFLTPLLEHPDFLWRLDNLSIQIEEEPPPPQPKVHTRKRRVTVPDDPPNE